MPSSMPLSPTNINQNQIKQQLENLRKSALTIEQKIALDKKVRKMSISDYFGPKRLTAHPKAMENVLQ